MSRIEDRLATLGLVLPPPLTAPAGTLLPFPFVRLIDNRANAERYSGMARQSCIPVAIRKLN